MIDHHQGWNKSFKPLFLGLTLSFILTIAAYRVDTKYHLPPTTLMWTLIFLAITQMILHCIFYFHLALEERPAWNSYSIYFVIVVLVIVIGGSIWIMSQIDYNMME
jgi:cytochrome o ubiquinol oxidase operon protein cyoD